jgi:hypothetical protein
LGAAFGVAGVVERDATAGGRGIRGTGHDSLTESVANREIVDEVKFKEGLGKVIDGTVQCLNASSWAQAK